MSEILIKLKNSSTRIFLTTMSGYSIFRNEWTKVNDNDKEIQRIITYRNDIEIKEIDQEDKSVVEKDEEENVSEKNEDEKEETAVEEYINFKIEEAEKEKGKALTKKQKEKIIKEIEEQYK